MTIISQELEKMTEQIIASIAGSSYILSALSLVSMRENWYYILSALSVVGIRDNWY